MKTTVLVSLAFLLTTPIADAATWSTFSFSTTPEQAPKVLAAADTLMSSKIGKEFPGRLLLQSFIANGSDPATHAFIPIYQSAAQREAFVEKMSADPAWAQFQKAMTAATQPTSQVLHRTVKRWGEIVDTDPVWIGHAFQVNDPPAFLAAIEDFMASATGKKFPGQVYLSSVVAGGISPVTHVISVGYASEVEMDSWIQMRNASEDWSDYLDTSDKVSEYLGANLSRNLKSWGPASMEQVTSP